MSFLYLDDSKHHQFGFSLAAFAICEADPAKELHTVFDKFGYDPSTFEFKSSARMNGDDRLQSLRSVLKNYIRRNCKVAICVVNGDKNLGPAALRLLQMAITHPKLRNYDHQVYFDEGLFSSADSAEALIKNLQGLESCSFFFEQDSQKIPGIQLADLVAHTCGTMLLDALGQVTKKVLVNSPGDSLYHNMEIELGFEMWADIRYAFLCRNKLNPKDDFELATPDVFPWGLFVDDSVDTHIATAAMERFGEVYLGCIH